MAELHESVSAIWSRHLGVEVALDDDFFDVGGDSFAAIQIAADLEELFGIGIAVPWVLDFPSVRSMCQKLASAKI